MKPKASKTTKKTATKKSTATAAKKAPAASKVSDGKKTTVKDHVEEALALEVRGDWSGATTAWRAAAQAATSRKDNASYTGKAAAADVRAQAKPKATPAAAAVVPAAAAPAAPVAAAGARASTPEEMKAEAATEADKKPRRAKGEGRAPRERKAFAHDERVKPYVGKTVTRSYTRKGETIERIAAVKVLADGFEYEGRHYTSLSKIAKEATGTAWFGPLFFGIVPYNKRERKGIGEPEQLASYHEAAKINRTLRSYTKDGQLPELPESLKDVLDKDNADEARADAVRMRAAAERYSAIAKALVGAANLIEVRRGKAVA